MLPDCEDCREANRRSVTTNQTIIPCTLCRRIRCHGHLKFVIHREQPTYLCEKCREFYLVTFLGTRWIGG